MRHTNLSAAISVGLALLSIGPVSFANSGGEVSEQKQLCLKTAVAPGEIRDYLIEAVIKGKTPSPDGAEPVDLDTAFRLNVRHRYSRREGDGLLPLEISLVDGRMTVEVEVEGKKQPQTLQITPSIYPRLTVLIDRDWRITDIFGVSADRMSKSFPGIRYDNHIILFYPQGLAEPRAVGEKWESSLKIPALNETYSFTNTLVGERIIDGIRAAVLRQEITRSAREDVQGVSTSMKAAAESTFAIDGGKLLRSHVDCDVIFSAKRPPSSGAGKDEPASKQDRTYCRANIKIDISPVKP